MAEQDRKKREADPLRNLLITEIYTTEALINILERKGLVTRGEILEEVRAMKDKADDQARNK